MPGQLRLSFPNTEFGGSEAVPTAGSGGPRQGQVRSSVLSSTCGLTQAGAAPRPGFTGAPTRQCWWLHPCTRAGL
jgi:hypothetical protein